jgi:hypothetical protein
MPYSCHADAQNSRAVTRWRLEALLATRFGLRVNDDWRDTQVAMPVGFPSTIWSRYSLRP